MVKGVPRKTIRGTDDPARRFVEFFDSFVTLLLFPPKVEVDALDLTHQETRALFWIGRHNPCLMSEFARGANIALSTATHIIDRLVKKRLVSRQRSETDRRVVEISLSELGMRRQHISQERFREGGEKLLSALTPSEIAVLVPMLRKMSARDQSQ